MTMGLSTRVHWIRIPDPHSMCRQPTHITLLDWISPSVPDYWHTAQHAARILIEAVWRQSGLWIRIPDANRIRIYDPVWRAPYRKSECTITVCKAEFILQPKVFFYCFVACAFPFLRYAISNFTSKGLPRVEKMCNVKRVSCS